MLINAGITKLIKSGFETDLEEKNASLSLKSGEGKTLMESVEKWQNGHNILVNCAIMAEQKRVCAIMGGNLLFWHEIEQKCIKLK